MRFVVRPERVVLKKPPMTRMAQMQVMDVRGGEGGVLRIPQPENATRAADRPGAE